MSTNLRERRSAAGVANAATLWAIDGLDTSVFGGIIGALAMVAFALAIVGVCGVVAFGVAQRGRAARLDSMSALRSD